MKAGDIVSTERVVTSQRTETESSHGEVSYRSYAVTWAWLLLFTILGVISKLVEMPRGMLVASVLTLMVLKAYLIFANFMHLREEMRNMLVIALAPLIMAVILFYGVGYDY